MATTKVDFKRELRELYSATRSPQFVEVPELQFAMVDGHGDPNVAPEYAEAVQALYSVAYTARFALKRAPDGLDYGVMPLEGLWWAQDMTAFITGRQVQLGLDDDDHAAGRRSTPEVFEDACAAASREEVSCRPSSASASSPSAEGRSAQVLHVGPYAAEGR